MPDQLVHVGNHAECLHSGRLIGPSDRVDAGELHEEDQYLVDEGRLVPVSSFDPPKTSTKKAAAADGGSDAS